MLERDDIIEYSLHAHHSEEEGKKIRKKIVFVTVLLSIITVVEVLVGVFFSRYEFDGTGTWMAIKYMYLGLTLLKAGYIVMVFMHLGDERKNIRWMILAPYIAFVLYLIFIALDEAVAVGQAM